MSPDEQQQFPRSAAIGEKACYSLQSWLKILEEVSMFAIRRALGSDTDKAAG